MIADLRERIATARARLPAVYWTLWTGTLINRMGGFVGPLLTFYLMKARGFDEATAGMVVAAFGAGQVLGSLTGGALADRIGRRSTMLLSLFAGSFLMVALGFATSLQAIAILAFALGAVGDMYRPAVFAVVSDVVPAKDRLYAFGLLYWAVNLGFAIAPALAGFVATYSYLALFLGDAATTFIYGIVVWRKVPETRPVRDVAVTSGPPPIRLVDVLTDRVFMAFVLLSFLFLFVVMQHAAALTAHLQHQGHGSGEFGAIMAINGILIVLLQPAITRRLGSADRPTVMACAALVMGVGFFMHGLSSWLGVHALAVAVWTLAEILNAPTSSTVVASLAPAEARGRYQGVFAMSWGGAACVAPLIGPRILRDLGPWPLWGGCLAVSVLVAIGVMAWGPALRRRMRAEDPAPVASPISVETSA